MVTPRSSNQRVPMTDADPTGITPGSLHRPQWMRDANCLEHPELDFVMAERSTPATREALQVCGRCLVRPECLAYALADQSLVGIWGGTDTAARRAIRKNRSTHAPT